MSTIENPQSRFLGSRAFVSATYQQFKGYFYTKNEKVPNPVGGLDGIFSLKRLSEGLPT